jgi:hypothetical protein
MPVAFAPLVGLALGAAFAWIAAPELWSAQGPIVTLRPFAIVVAFAAFVWLPTVGYFVAFHGDWSYLYVVPWRRIPSAVDLGLVLFSAGTVVLGFSLAVRPVRKRRFGPVAAMLVVPLAFALGGVSLSTRRLAVSATYAQFHGDFGTQPIGSSPLGKGVLVMGGLLVLAVFWTVRSLARIAAESRD